MSLGSPSFLARHLGHPRHMLKVITLVPIKRCLVALLSPKGLAHFPRRFARELLLERNHRWEPKSLHQSLLLKCDRISIALSVAKNGERRMAPQSFGPPASLPRPSCAAGVPHRRPCICMENFGLAHLLSFANQRPPTRNKILLPGA